MSDFEYPVEALRAEVVALLDREDVPHLMGERELKTNRAAPYYVWVPTRWTEGKETASPGVEEYRGIVPIREHFDIHCRGRSLRQTAAMARNVVKAMRDSAFADISLDNAKWVDPRAAWNQDGEALVLSCNLQVDILDAFIDIDDLLDPEQSTVVVEAVEGDVEKSDDINADGEHGLTVEV